MALFSLVVVTFSGALISGQQGQILAGARSRASYLAEEGLEAVRNIRDENFSNLSDGNHGLAISGNSWTLWGTEDKIDNNTFTRQIIISSLDANTKKIESKITWQQNLQRSGQITLTTYLSNWDITIFEPGGSGGVLVYSSGGTTSDAIQYRVLDTDGNWSEAQATADIDPATTNKHLRYARVFSSATRNEKILVSRHYNGSAQFIYAQVFNGSGWGSLQLLSNWNSTANLDVKNLSGTYLNNGNFMVVYSDNTTTPKYRIWDGSSWSASSLSTNNIGGIPNHLVVKARAGTDEVMAAFLGQANDTNTLYYNGSSWSTATEHATATTSATKEMVDFAWSPNNPLIGGLVYANNKNDRNINIKIWTADGSGGGSWSATADSSNQSANLGALTIAGRKGADEFIACDKNAASTPQIICYQSSFAPAWSDPVNQTIATSTDTGIQKSYDIGYEANSGELALGVYSDTSAIPKLKKYDSATTTWDASPVNITSVVSALETVTLIPKSDSDDIMILMANTNQDIYSLVWDGANNALFSTPAGKAFSAHGTSGCADTNFWFDFDWDRN